MKHEHAILYCVPIMHSALRYIRVIGVWAAIAALSLRSLIPAGYMPDFAHSHALFALTVCDGVGHDMSSMPMVGQGGGQGVDHGGEHAAHMHHEHHSGSNGNVCPFSVGAVYGFDGIAAPVLTPPVFALAAAAPRMAQALQRQRAFTIASPRAPPSFS